MYILKVSLAIRRSVFDADNEDATAQSNQGGRSEIID